MFFFCTNQQNSCSLCSSRSFFFWIKTSWMFSFVVGSCTSTALTSSLATQVYYRYHSRVTTIVTKIFLSILFHGTQLLLPSFNDDSTRGLKRIGTEQHCSASCVKAQVTSSNNIVRAAATAHRRRLTSFSFF